MTAKILEDYNDVFADIVNVLVFRKREIQEDELVNGPTESIYKAAGEKYREQRRDVFKHWKHANLTIASFGLENQSEMDSDMPVRVMGYDYASYRSQIQKQGKSDKELDGIAKSNRIPTVTLVLNLSQKDWDAPKTLYDWLEMPQAIQPFVSDYRCNVIDIHRLEDEVIEKFQSDFKQIAYFFKYGTITTKQGGEKLQHPQEVVDFLGAFSKGDFREAKERINKRLEKGDVVSMCTIVEDLQKKAEEDGRRLGVEEGHKLGVQEGLTEGQRIEIEKMTLKLYYKKYALEDIAELVELSEQEVRDIIDSQGKKL